MTAQPMTRDRSSPAFSQESSFSSEIDTFLDFDNNNFLTSPADGGLRSSSSPSSASSAQSTPSMTQANPSTFPAPSHPYNQYPQQTDLDISDGFYNFMNPDSDSAISSANSQLPPYFFPEHTLPTTMGADVSQGISPLMTIGEMQPIKMEPVTPVPTVRPQPQPQRVNYYPGYHQEMYNENVRMQAQKMARQKATATAAPKASLHPQQGEIDRILNSFKISTSSVGGSKNPNDILPHIARMKKEEEDMDEDERLLASEEGKKLSSKERRQLRNKVSARAFRSRRKEYISQLEAEVAKKTQEAEAAKEAARRLQEENTRLRNFSEMLMKQPAFQEFLKELSGPLINQPAATQPAVAVAPTVAEPIPTFNPTRDANPNVASDEQWPLAYGANWNNISHVYNVQVPDYPAFQDLDGKGMCMEEDYTIADGFFSGIRDTKGDIDYTRMDEAEDTYQPPENLEDAYAEEEQEKKKSLDELFPGVGVDDFLEKLEMVAGGQVRPEDVFEMEAPAVVEQPRTAVETTGPRQCVTVNKSNRMLKEAEGVYRRIGMTVGGGQ